MGTKDPESMIFGSKSCLCESIPGGSLYTDMGNAAADKKLVRMAFSGNYAVQEIDDESCRFVVVQWTDLCGGVPPCISNVGNRVWFQPVYQRVHKWAACQDTAKG